MLNTFPAAVIAGSLLGFLSGLGIGGGSLLILWLTLVLEFPREQAAMINLLFFIPSAVIACLFRWKQGKLDIKQILPALIGGCAGAILLSLFSRHMDTELLRKPYGILLLLTGLRELFYRARKDK